MCSEKEVARLSLGELEVTMRWHVLPMAWWEMDGVELFGALQPSMAIEISVGFRMLASGSQVVPNFPTAAVAE